MKKIFLIAAFIGFALTSNAQSTMQLGVGTLTFRKSPDFDDASVLGSKYLTEDFSQAKVNKGTQNFLIRYNAYSDLMEYQNDGELLELIKEQNTHFQFANGEVYELLQYNLKGSSVSRYHQILTDQNNVKVSKFRSIKLEEAKAPSNSYDSATPASYKRNRDSYFITINGQTTEFDGKQRSVQKLFPSKSAEIKKFFKENKIKTNDEDMVKLGDFLATL